MIYSHPIASDLPRGSKQPLTRQNDFAHRPGGPQDRLKVIDWDDYFAGQITDHPHAIEVELWYRRSSQARTDSQRDVTILLRQAGGQVLSSAIIDEIGYHGLKCTVPTSVLVDLANGRFDAVQVVKSANVMYLRVTGQAVPLSGPVTEANVDVDAPLPDLPPIVCLLDGVPAANHPLLDRRVIIHEGYAKPSLKKCRPIAARNDDKKVFSGRL